MLTTRPGTAPGQATPFRFAGRQGRRTRSYMQKNSILGFLAPATALAVLASAGHCMAATSAPPADGPGGQYPLLPSSMLAPNLIEASGAVIGSVKVANGNIFDLDDPAEDKALDRKSVV